MTDDDRLECWAHEALLFDAEPTPEETAAAERVLALVHRAPRRRRLRRWVAGLSAVVVVGGGAAVATAVIGDGQPRQAEGGIGCRVAADPAADVVVVDHGADPIESCRRVWAAGVLGMTVPESMTACIGLGGSLEVYPGGPDTCGAIGLEPASLEMSDRTKAILDLEDRLRTEVNAVPCVSVEETAEHVRQIVAESPLSDWTVVVNPDAVGADCGVAGIDSANDTVFVAIA